MRRYVFAITGASGPLIGITVLKELVQTAEVHLVISKQSFQIMHDESTIDWFGSTDKDIQNKIRKFYRSKRIYYYDEADMYAPMASGSFQHDGMFVVPCSMKSLSAIAHGYANTLFERAADVTIKEGRQLVISPRETPFSAIHLENMLKLARLGVKVVPPIIGFYHEPKDLENMIDFISGKILDAMSVEHDLYKRWTSKRHAT
jgi:4-hydroxy-3-polyprenylbenzoate decarboxylase